MPSAKMSRVFRRLKSLSFCIEWTSIQRKEFDDAFYEYENCQESDYYFKVSLMSALSNSLESFEKSSRVLNRFRLANGLLPGEVRFFFI